MSDDLAPRLAAAVAPTYTLGRRLGAGGCAVVYAARDERLGRDVAIKTLRPELDSGVLRDRFRREAESAARLSHPHVIPIHDVGERDGLAWIVMPLVQGESLADLLDRDGALPAADVARILLEVADALGHAHDAGIVHRDIKPENVLLEGTARRVILADFGVAKLLDDADQSLTATGIVVGTPSAMSPEQLAGDAPVDARADVWAFGVMAYRALTGQLPFSAPTVTQLVGQIIAAAPTPIAALAPETPAWLAQAVMTCLEKDAARRPADGAAIAARLRAGPSGASPVETAPAAKRQRPAALLASLGGVALVAGLEAPTGRWRLTPFAALAAALALAIARGWRARPQVQLTGATTALARPLALLRTERRVAAAILLQVPRVERARWTAVAPLLDDAVTEADRLAAGTVPGARRLLQEMAEAAQRLRQALERREASAIADASQALQRALDAVRPAAATAPGA